MEIKPVSGVLQAAGLAEPTLAALVPDVNNYETLLFQPDGEIDASAAGVANRNRALAKAQFKEFLAQAVTRNTHLAITPEYSLPWEVLIEAIQTDAAPSAGSIWVLGCESIKYSELQTIRDSLSARATFLFEPLPAHPDRFVDPLAYVFSTKTIDGNADRLVVLVQFKTTPMADADHFEVNNLQRGTRIYQFGGADTLRLASLICSDVLAFTDADAKAMYDRALIVHIQLNPKPRHPQYRQYRDILLGYAGDATELICLNWASNVREWSDGTEKQWKNISGSAWYLRPDKFDARDETLHGNHKRGLYYTWLSTLCFHVLFFNYAPGVFVLNASKVAHLHVKGVASRRRGPQLTTMLVWNAGSHDWAEQLSVDDGFSGIANEAGDAKEHVARLSAINPLYAERALALSVGQVSNTDEWYVVNRLDSCGIDASEIIQRLTFCQDTCERAVKFRTARLKLCRRLVSILKTEKLPSSLRDFTDGFQLDWLPNSPHQNARTTHGGPATVIYVGEQTGQTERDALRARITTFLNRSFKGPDETVTAVQRLAIWYQEDGQLRIMDPERYLQIDSANRGGELNIARED